MPRNTSDLDWLHFHEHVDTILNVSVRFWHCFLCFDPQRPATSTNLELPSLQLQQNEDFHHWNVGKASNW